VADARRGRSFSSDPRRLPPLTSAQLATLERREAAMTDQLLRVLDADAAVAAVVSRVGSDLSRQCFEGDVAGFTHMALALREHGEWWIHHLLNTAAGPYGHLYRHPPADFFRDDPFEYRAGVLVPSVPLQERIASVLLSPVRDRLHTPRYSCVSYPFATKYQSSNQWVLEIVAAAQGGGSDRRAVQCFLASAGFRPSVLRTAGILGQIFHALTVRNAHFDDHPLRNRLRGRIEFVLHTSLHRYLQLSDSPVERVFSLDAPPDSPRHGTSHPTR
jgi:hypothetical protein